MSALPRYPDFCDVHKVMLGMKGAFKELAKEWGNIATMFSGDGTDGLEGTNFSAKRGGRLAGIILTVCKFMGCGNYDARFSKGKMLKRARETFVKKIKAAIKAGERKEGCAEHRLSDGVLLSSIRFTSQVGTRGDYSLFENPKP